MGMESAGEQLPDAPTVATRGLTRPLRQKKKFRFILPSPSREEFAGTAPNVGEFVADKLVDFGESAVGKRGCIGFAGSVTRLGKIPGIQRAITGSVYSKVQEG
jgi:hypothetical protein